MEIVERQVGGVTILDLKGKLTLRQGDELLLEKIHDLVSQGMKKILLSMEQVPYLDSAGLGEVFRSLQYVRRNGGELKLLFISHRVESFLLVTKLFSSIDSFQDEREALISFQ